MIIGNVNAITYKEIFSLIKDNKLWLGVSIKSGDRKFNVPDSYPLGASGCGVEIVDGKERKYIKVKGVRWFVNLENKKRNEPLETKASFAKEPEKYPKYDNYNAINVDKTNEIPLDYDGVMGVPITFLDKHNPKQFEILGIMNSKVYFFSFYYGSAMRRIWVSYPFIFFARIHNSVKSLK